MPNESMEAYSKAQFDYCTIETAQFQYFTSLKYISKLENEVCGGTGVYNVSYILKQWWFFIFLMLTLWSSSTEQIII